MNKGAVGGLGSGQAGARCGTTTSLARTSPLARPRSRLPVLILRNTRDGGGGRPQTTEPGRSTPAAPAPSRRRTLRGAAAARTRAPTRRPSSTGRPSRWRRHRAESASDSDCGDDFGGRSTSGLTKTETPSMSMTTTRTMVHERDDSSLEGDAGFGVGKCGDGAVTKDTRQTKGRHSTAAV